MPLFLPKHFPAFCSSFSGESKSISPQNFPPIHPNTQSHLPLLRSRPPLSRATPGCSRLLARRLFIQPGVRHAPGARTATTNPAEWRVCKERAQGTGGGRGAEEGEFREWVGGGGKRRGSGGCSRSLQQRGVGGEAGPGLRVGLGVPLKRRLRSGRPALSLLARERGRRTDREPVRERE